CERTAGIRAEVNAPLVVIVGVKVVPNERLPAEDSPHFADRFDLDGFRNNVRPGPEDLNGGIEKLSDLFEVVRAPGGSRHSFAVVRGTEEQVRFGSLFAEELQQMIGRVALRLTEGVKRPGILFRQRGLNVVEQNGEPSAA